MQIKKYKHADLEGKRPVFFQVGIIIALGASFAAFEWGSADVKLPEVIAGNEEVEEMDLPKIIKVEEKEPEQVKKIEIPDILELTKDDDPRADEPNFSSEVTDETMEVKLPDPEPEEVDDEVHILVERMPEFPGGMSALMTYFVTNVKYPAICAEMGIEGRVYVTFVVEKDGHVSAVRVLRSPDNNLSNEAVRVVSGMPCWSPGKQNGKPVRVAFTVPVNFRLQ